MEQLTAQQAKQVIEYFAAQAAEDAPLENADKHMWMTRYQTSLAIERQITEADWDSLVGRMANLQSFDRDPEGWMTEHGFDLSYGDNGVTYVKDGLEDQVSWAIDTAYTCSGA